MAWSRRQNPTAQMSATRNSRVEDESVKRSKYQAHYQLREMFTMSAMPKQRRDWMPRPQGRVEAKSR